MLSENASLIRARRMVRRGQPWGNQHGVGPQVAAPPGEVHRKALYAANRSASHGRSIDVGGRVQSRAWPPGGFTLHPPPSGWNVFSLCDIRARFDQARNSIWTRFQRRLQEIVE
jgi:hypothetical protein